MTRIRSFWRAAATPLLALALLAGLAPRAHAQTALNSTTLSASIDNDQRTIPLVAVTNIAANDILWIDGEAMDVTSACDTTAKTCPVRRGGHGTGSGVPKVAGRGHASGAVVYTGRPLRFYLDEVTGSCTAANERFLPHIVLTSGNAYDCKSGEWVITRTRGFRDGTPGRTDGGTTYTASGAITVQPGVVFINGTTLAMTIVDPTTEQNGTVMYIIATNGSAHTLTYTAGFGGGTTARDVATFGGAVNDEIAIVAFNGVWWVLYTRNVTLG